MSSTIDPNARVHADVDNANAETAPTRTTDASADAQTTAFTSSESEVRSTVLGFSFNDESVSSVLVDAQAGRIMGRNTVSIDGHEGRQVIEHIDAVIESVPGGHVEGLTIACPSSELQWVLKDGLSGDNRPEWADQARIIDNPTSVGVYSTRHRSLTRHQAVAVVSVDADGGPAAGYSVAIVDPSSGEVIDAGEPDAFAAVLFADGVPDVASGAGAEAIATTIDAVALNSTEPGAVLVIGSGAGGAGVADALEEQTGLPVTVAPQPTYAVATGAAIVALEENADAVTADFAASDASSGPGDKGSAKAASAGASVASTVVDEQKPISKRSLIIASVVGGLVILGLIIAVLTLATGGPKGAGNTSVSTPESSPAAPSQAPMSIAPSSGAPSSQPSTSATRQGVTGAPQVSANPNTDGNNSAHNNPAPNNPPQNNPQRPQNPPRPVQPAPVAPPKTAEGTNTLTNNTSTPPVPDATWTQGADGNTTVQNSPQQGTNDDSQQGPNNVAPDIPAPNGTTTINLN